MSKRVHKALRLEELESRVAPATLSAANPIYTFTDLDGDQMQVKYSGPGTANIQWATGGATPSGNDDIKGITLSGTTASSKLTMKDLNPGTGPDTLVGGSITGAAGESFGSIQLLAGKGMVAFTTVDIKQNLGTMNVQGVAGFVNLTVGGNLTKQTFQGDVYYCLTAVQGNTSLYQVTGSMWHSRVKTLGNVNSFQVSKDINYATLIQIGGDAPNVQVKGNMSLSALAAQGTAKITIGGAVTYCDGVGAGNLTYLSVGSVNTAGIIGTSSIGSFTCKGNLTNALIRSQGNVGTIQILGNVTGSLKGAPTKIPTMDLQGNVKNLTIAGDLKEAEVVIGGNLGTAKVQGATHATMFSVFGNANQATFSKAVTWSWVGVAGTANTLQFDDSITASFVAVGGKTTTFKALNGLKDSWLWLAGGADNVYLNNGVDNALVGIGGSSLKLLQVTGGLTNNSHITVGEGSASCNVTKAQIDGGINNANLTVHGNTNLLKVTGGIQGSSMVDITGQVTTAQLYGTGTTAGIATGSTVKMGSLQSSLLVTGGLAGTVDIVGSAASANITVNGDLTGSLLAGVFGNVTVNGNFTGQIGDSGTAPGNGTLKVTGSAVGGSVTPGTAFGNYIW
ncbi:MAG: hypothetical protein GXP25_12515 [Planctomycetes bacterium]|nr:hypothetical protein [Planctomycetota bacterium]